VTQALAAGKHVFVEKPLAITAAELAQIESAWNDAPGERRPLLMVGFNRRFAPQVVRMKALLQTAPGPKSFVVTVNTGAMPADHWTQAAAVGGGRIIGEGCHFIDLLRFLAGAPIGHWDLATSGDATAASLGDDQATITLTFTDGSTGTLHYFSNGHAPFPKERIEAFCSGRVLQLDNFRRLRGYGWSGFTAMNLWQQNKGQDACVGPSLRRSARAAARQFRSMNSPVVLDSGAVQDD
jgi:predicted dehydrogenase